MKTNKILTVIAVLLTASLSVQAQENNLVINGSFENLSETVHSTGAYILADSISSSNNTSVDLFSKNACGRDYKVPANYMGTQESKTGNNYAGIIAYYADEAGIFKTKPGYQKYSEYIQFAFREPLTAGKAYRISFNASLAEKSAYAVSGLGVYFSTDKVDVKNNAFMQLTPHFTSAEILNNTEWTIFTGVYVAGGGERYLTLGCFEKYMETLKIVPPYTNNSRKAYYYIDDVGMSPEIISTESMASILAGSCFQLNNLNFETDKAVIAAGSFDELKLLTDFLKTYPYVVVYLDGHTDKTGTAKHNNILSAERAAAVKAFLVKNGIEEARLKTRGFGESLPLDIQNESSQANRRVEITICAALAIKEQVKP